MNALLLSINLVIAIAIMLILILKFKVNAVISLILSTIYMGLSCGLGFAKTAATINSGFGNLMVGIGLPIGFGIMMGQILSDSGAAKALAVSMLKRFPGNKAAWALGFTAFLLSIPVFFDVTFIILIPLGLAVAKQSKIPIPYIAGAIAIGGVCSQTFVPPTPNPLAAATILKFDLGTMVIVGFIIGLIAAIVSMFIWFKRLDKGLWNVEKDESGLVCIEDAEDINDNNLPSSMAAILPIITPVICILIGTTWKAVTGSEPSQIIKFMSDKTIAILLGLLVAYIIAKKHMTWKKLEEATTISLKTAGVVLLVTGAGGSFGAVIQATGIGTVLTKGLSGGSTSTQLILLITFLIGMTFRVAQGSGTVASITTMTIMASVAPSLSCHPVYLAVAALAGGNFIGHVNDSGYWVVTNLSGLTVTGGFKTYTFNTVTLAGTAFILALIGSVVFPMI